MIIANIRKNKFRVKAANELKRMLEEKIAANSHEVHVVPHSDRKVAQLTGKQLERFLSRVARRRENLV
jgi:hypothetical protein